MFEYLRNCDEETCSNLLLFIRQCKEHRQSSRSDISSWIISDISITPTEITIRSEIKVISVSERYAGRSFCNHHDFSDLNDYGLSSLEAFPNDHI